MLVAAGDAASTATAGNSVAVYPDGYPEPIFIEDHFRSTIKSKFHMLMGVAGNGFMQSVDTEKAPWLDAVKFDMAPHAAQLRSVPPTPSRGPARGQLDVFDKVRIYVHKVPRCAGEELLEHFTAWDDGFGWRRAMKLHSEHMAAVHYAILNSSAVVEDPAEATVFYIPAFFGLLVERWIDTRNPAAINCMVRAWHELPDEILMRNAGYDHFIVAGTCHPFNICSTMECDITLYHPFAGNVMVLSGGIREYGHPDKVFAPAAVYPLLRHVFVPFPVRLDCALLAELCRPGHMRPIAVSFVGSENSRIRHSFRVEMERRLSERGPDQRLFIHVLEDDLEGGGRVREAMLEQGGQGLWQGQMVASAAELYASSEFCLLLPGHVFDFGRRGFDFMARGCVPVVVTEHPMFISFPFPGQLPWEDLAVFSQVHTLADVAAVLDLLLEAASSAEGQADLARRRAALLEHAPQIYLPPHANCPASAGSATDLIVRELGVRQAAWASLRFMQPDSLGLRARGLRAGAGL